MANMFKVTVSALLFLQCVHLVAASPKASMRRVMSEGTLIHDSTSDGSKQNDETKLLMRRERKSQSPVPIQVLHSEDSPKAKAFVEHLLIWQRGAPDSGNKLHKLHQADAFPLPSGTESLTCTQGQCTVNGPAHGEALKQIEGFKQAATSLHPTTDKVEAHQYQIMYGTYLLAQMQHADDHGKLFEIGLGCGMGYGPGASVALWKKLFPDTVLWEAEYDAECVKRSRERNMLKGINTVTGDQGDQSTVKAWAATSGGKFDAVIDDGGHHNKQIRTSFETLWPHVKPGGLYFLEDLHVGRTSPYNDKGEPVIADRVEAWVEQLLTQSERSDLPLPEGVETIFCQAQACMLRKAS